MKKLLALLLALCMILTLAACSADNTDEDEDNGKKKTKATKDKEENPNDEQEQPDDLHEGLKAYEYEGLRFYLSDDFNKPIEGYAESGDMEIDVCWYDDEELESMFGESVNSSKSFMNAAKDSLEGENYDIVKKAAENDIWYIHAEHDGEIYVYSFYYEDGYGWIVSLCLNEDADVEAAIKYATICEIVGTPNIEDDELEDDEDEDREPRPPVDVPTEVFTSVEGGGCLVSIVDIDTESFMGYTLNVYLQNNSDVDVLFTTGTTIVDGLQVGSTLYEMLAPGENCYAELVIEDYFIPEGEPELHYTNISVELIAREDGNYLDDPFINETVQFVSPYADTVIPYVREMQADDVVLLDNEYATIIQIGSEMDDFWGYSAYVYIINKTDLTLGFYSPAATINGKEADAIFVPEIAPGCGYYDDIFFSDYEELGVTQPEEIKVSLEGRDADNWSSDCLFTEEITLIP